jgi:hypothetical protein
MILPLIVSLCHSWGAKGGITELTVVILCSQDHSASWLEGAHLTPKTQEEVRLKRELSPCFSKILLKTEKYSKHVA